jgi:hypothetical protein
VLCGFQRQTDELLSNPVDGMDKDSLRAAVVLVSEIESRLTLLYLLHAQRAHGEVREDGVAVVYCDGECRTTTNTDNAV